MVALTLMAFGGSGACAETPAALEYQVKAAFLVKLAMFVDFPSGAFAGATDPVQIGILGDDPFGGFFDEAVRTEKVNGRSFRLKRAKEVDELSNCQIIFVAASEESRSEDIVRALRDRPVLTVADHPQFTGRGGMVNFVKDSGRIHLEVNLAAAESAGLRFSAKFLQIARVVAPARGKARS